MSEWPYDEPPTAQLQAEAEVDRLRADLATCRRRFPAIYDLCDEAMTINGLVEVRLIRAALAAGGGGQDEGDGR